MNLSERIKLLQEARRLRDATSQVTRDGLLQNFEAKLSRTLEPHMAMRQIQTSLSEIGESVEVLKYYSAGRKYVKLVQVEDALSALERAMLELGAEM